MTAIASVSKPSSARTRSWMPQLAADLMGLLAIAAVVVTTWIWARAGGLLQTFVYPQYLLESQALYTGLLSQVLMILMVLFMARIPWVERSWGHDVPPSDRHDVRLTLRAPTTAVRPRTRRKQARLGLRPSNR
jgi:hypothetical protein